MKNKLLSEEAILRAKNQLPQWEITLEGRLRRQWKFKDFIEAFGFMTKVAIISEKINHHPEWRNVYATLTIELTTHDLAGLSELDLELARRINEICDS